MGAKKEKQNKTCVQGNLHRFALDPLISQEFGRKRETNFMKYEVGFWEIFKNWNFAAIFLFFFIKTCAVHKPR